IIDEGCQEEQCGTISEDTTWGAVQGGHLITCDVYVQGANAPMLTIADGAVVRFADGFGLYIGVGGQGGLKVMGSTNGVLLTSNKSTAAAGDWKGLFISQNALPATEINGLTLEYAGGGFSTDPAGLTVSYPGSTIP